MFNCSCVACSAYCSVLLHSAHQGCRTTFLTNQKQAGAELGQAQFSYQLITGLVFIRACLFPYFLTGLLAYLVLMSYYYACLHTCSLLVCFLACFLTWAHMLLVFKLLPYLLTYIFRFFKFFRGAKMGVPPKISIFFCYSLSLIH